ncbi:MAG: rhomboid family intramembrane serine protease, partial [Chlamydiia bacterium]|nr:rhomboid family intramembrane serine protease [Chlamydiia bacterium]
MRLIGSINNPELAERFSRYLDSLEIKHRIEMSMNSDWGSDDYGTPQASVWIVEEEDVDRASHELEKFRDSPTDPLFAKARPHVHTPPVEVLGASAPKPEKAGSLTLYLIMLCALLFVWGSLTMPQVTKRPVTIEQASPAVNKELYYDWPYTTPPTPVWQGIYPKVVAYLQGNADEATIREPLFVKIREGEVWRLFTPALLHANIFHLFFNMLWLLVLGRQMEDRLGKGRYILFILLTGIFSNTCQYLMSGSNFLGISGVLAGMLAYIWVRQRKAPWEGYLL